ncbi:MAG: helix-hairpin-helix domain-containing protein [Actinomycetota bacterium]|nr:helix-hairpin-helix domain-containing protein [Actinomycetota bacterium]
MFDFFKRILGGGQSREDLEREAENEIRRAAEQAHAERGHRPSTGWQGPPGMGGQTSSQRSERGSAETWSGPGRQRGSGRSPGVSSQVSDDLQRASNQLHADEARNRPPTGWQGTPSMGARRSPAREAPSTAGGGSEPAAEDAPRRQQPRGRERADTAEVGGGNGGPLDEKLRQVSGVGHAKQKALIEHFGSVEAIRDASVDELTEVPGVGRRVAELIHDSLR